MGARAANPLEAKIVELGPDNVIAFVAETVVGATVGAVPPAPGYFKRIREICDRHGVLLILDEVMCGMGRTGTLHACEQEGIAPDLMTIAKGLGGGYQPIGAALLQQKIFDAFANGAKLPARPHLYRPPDGLRGGARGAAVDQARRSARQRQGDGRAASSPALRALRQSPACRRHPRPRPVPGDRARRRPRHRRRRSSRSTSCTPGSKPRRWRAA